jgi:regulatory Fis family protein
MTYRDALREFDIGYWSAMLEETGGNIDAAARLARVNRTHLYVRLKRIGLKNPCRAMVAHRGDWSTVIMDLVRSSRSGDRR